MAPTPPPSNETWEPLVRYLRRQVSAGEMTFEEALRTVVRRIGWGVARGFTAPCWECRGTGLERAGWGPGDCPACAGTGWVYVAHHGGWRPPQEGGKG